eukprot:7067309-Prymnesium_polylepis.2
MEGVFAKFGELIHWAGSGRFRSDWFRVILRSSFGLSVDGVDCCFVANRTGKWDRCRARSGSRSRGVAPVSGRGRARWIGWADPDG